MDLITGITITDLIAGVSLSMMIGVLGTALAANLQHLWSSWNSNPIVQSIVNTTLVVLETTEVVWKPVVNTSLVLVKPIVSFALQVLKPLGPLAVILADNLVKALVILGFMITNAVIIVSRTIHSFVSFLQSAGLNVTSALQTFAHGTKEFASAISKIVYWAGYFLYEVVYSVSYLIDSCEQVGLFLYRIFFESHKVTWNDVYNISIPFFVVAALVSIVVWRATKGFRKPYAPEKKNDEECYMPRRSSRIARKRAMLLCSDFPLASEKPSSRTANL